MKKEMLLKKILELRTLLETCGDEELFWDLKEQIFKLEIKFELGR